MPFLITHVTIYDYIPILKFDFKKALEKLCNDHIKSKFPAAFWFFLRALNRVLCSRILHPLFLI